MCSADEFKYTWVSNFKKKSDDVSMPLHQPPTHGRKGSASLHV